MKRNAKLGLVLVISTMFLMSLFITLTFSPSLMDVDLQNDDLNRLDLSIGGDYTCFVNYTNEGDFLSYYGYSGTPDIYSDSGDHLYCKLSDNIGPGEVFIRKTLNWSSEFITDSSIHYRIKSFFETSGDIYARFRIYYSDSTYETLKYFHSQSGVVDITEWNTVYPNQSKTLDYIEIWLSLNYGEPAVASLEFWLYDETYNGYSPCIKNWEIHPFNMKINQPHFFAGEFYNKSNQEIQFQFVETGNEKVIKLNPDWTQNNFYSTNTSFYRTGIYSYRYVAINGWGVATFTPEYQIFVHAFEYPQTSYLNVRSYEYRDVPETLFYVYLGIDETETLFDFRNKWGDWQPLGNVDWAFGYERITFNCSNGGIKSNFNHIAVGRQYNLQNLTLTFDVRTLQDRLVLIVNPQSYDMDYLLYINESYQGKWVTIRIPFFMFQNFDSANGWINALGFYSNNGTYELANIKLSNYYESTTLIDYSPQINNTSEFAALESNSTYYYPLVDNTSRSSLISWDNQTRQLNSTYSLSCINTTTEASNTTINSISDPTNDLPDPDSHWKLDESSGTNAMDSAGLDNNGTLVNMAGSEWDPGKYNNALHLDGYNDRIDLANTKTFSSTAGTISLWFKSDVDTNTYSSNKWLLGRNRGGNNVGDLGVHFYNAQSDKLLFVIQTGGVTRTILSDSANFNAGQWYFFVGTWNSSEFVMYIDNIRQADVDPGVTLYAHNLDHMCIAQQSTGAPMNGETFDGFIDDIRIYDECLSITEIETLYNGFGVNETISFNTTQINKDNVINVTLNGNITFNNGDINYTIGFYNSTSGNYTYATFNDSITNYPISLDYFNETNIILRLNHTSNSSFIESYNLTIRVSYFYYSNASYFYYFNLNQSSLYYYQEFLLDYSLEGNTSVSFDWQSSQDNASWSAWDDSLDISEYYYQYLRYWIKLNTSYQFNTSQLNYVNFSYILENITAHFLDFQLNTTVTNHIYLLNTSMVINITSNFSEINSSVSIYNFTSETYENTSRLMNLTYSLSFHQNSSVGLVLVNFSIYSSIAFNLTFEESYIVGNNSDYFRFCYMNISDNILMSDFEELSFWYNFSDSRALLTLQLYNGSWYPIYQFNNTPLSYGLGNGSATSRFSQYWRNITIDNDYTKIRFYFLLESPINESDTVDIQLKRFEMINESTYRLRAEMNRQNYDRLTFEYQSATLLLVDFAGREIYRESHNYSLYIDIYINIGEITLINYLNVTTWFAFTSRGVTITYGVASNSERNVLILLGDYWVDIMTDEEVILDVRDVSITTTNKTSIQIGVTPPEFVIPPQLSLLELFWEAVIVIFTFLTTDPLGIFLFILLILYFLISRFRKSRKKKDRDRKIYDQGFEDGIQARQNIYEKSQKKRKESILIGGN